MMNSYKSDTEWLILNTSLDWFINQIFDAFNISLSYLAESVFFVAFNITMDKFEYYRSDNLTLKYCLWMNDLLFYQFIWLICRVYFEVKVVVYRVQARMWSQFRFFSIVGLSCHLRFYFFVGGDTTGLISLFVGFSGDAISYLLVTVGILKFTIILNLLFTFF